MNELDLTPSKGDSDLSLELLMLMDVAVLRRVAPKLYALEGLAPGFYTKAFPQDADGAHCRAPWNYSPMLEFFLDEAEEFFESGPAPGTSLASGLWMENLDSGEELPMTATAMALKNGQCLLIQTMHEEYTNRIRQLRRARAGYEEEKRKVASLLRTTSKKSLFDHTTKLYNREAFSDLVQSQIASLSVYAPNLALIMVSLDNFETPGEERSPVELENLLSQFGPLLRRVLRKSDTVVHHGSGVFFIISPGTTLPQAVLAAERLCTMLSSHDFGLGHPLTLYLGCTIYRTGEDAKEFTVRARLALMDAVNMGPNQIGQRDPWGKIAGFPDSCRPYDYTCPPLNLKIEK